MTTMMKRAGKYAYDMRRGDSYVLPHDRRRVAVGLRWEWDTSSSSSKTPLDFTVFGSCTLLDSKGNLIATLSAMHTTNDHTGTSIRFVPDPIFDFPSHKRSLDDYSMLWMGGDDNAIVVDLRVVPDDVAEIVFVLTMPLEDHESFGQLSYIGCRLIDDPHLSEYHDICGTEQCVFEVTCNQLNGTNAVYLSRLERIPRSLTQPSKQSDQQSSSSSKESSGVPEVPCKKVSDEFSGDGKKDDKSLARPNSTPLKSPRKRKFDLSIDEPKNPSEDGALSTTTPLLAEKEENGFCNDDDWRFVAIAEAIEGTTAAFASYAVSARAIPNNPRRQFIYELGGAEEAKRKEEDKDMTDYAHTSWKPTIHHPPTRNEPLFFQSDMRAREAEDDHYTGFVEFANLEAFKKNSSDSNTEMIDTKGSETDSPSRVIAEGKCVTTPSTSQESLSPARSRGKKHHNKDQKCVVM